MLALAPVKNAGVIQEHDFPSAFRPGEAQLVTWSLDIQGCEGFARFQIQLPEGLTAEPRETANASFSFESGKAKFIWMELPAQSSLQVALTITASPDFSGGEVTQWFSFIQNGSRKDIEFEPHHVARGTETPLPETVHPSPLNVERTWKPTSAEAGTMTVHISGHESGQFLKLTESIGSYQSLSVLEDNECQIRDAFDGKLVCIWQAAPSEDQITVQYMLKGGQPEKIQGSVSTVLGDSPKEVVVPPVPSTSASAPSPPDPIAVAPSRQEIAFRVQVLATRNEVSTRAVQRTYAFPGELRLEQHENWFKYTTGYHTTYRSARDNRVELRQNHAFPGPFVAAYKDGRRITVQEALLVTKQNWIP